MKQDREFEERQKHSATADVTSSAAIARLQVPDYRPQSTLDYDYTDSDLRVKVGAKVVINWAIHGPEFSKIITSITSLFAFFLVL